MNLGMFTGSGDLKWLNVFQPSNREVGDSKASIATSLFLKTFSLQGETSKSKARAMSLLNTFADLFLKVKKGAFQALWERTACDVSMPSVSVIWFWNLPEEEYVPGR